MEQALESIFEQRFDFPVELLLGDDASTDDSRAVMERVLAKRQHPHIRVRRLYSDTNLGMHANTRRLFAQAEGRYIALLEGDDYWCHPEKLARQVAILDAAPETYLVAHGTDFLWQNNGSVEHKEMRWNRWRTHFTVRDYIREHFFHTSSIVMRNVALKWPDWLNEVKQLDQFLVLTHAAPSCDGIRFLPEVMSVYRKHDQGVTKTAEHRNHEITSRSLITGLTRFDEFSDGRYSRQIRHRIEDIRVKHAARTASGWDKYKLRLQSPGVYLRRLEFRLIRAL